MATAPPRTKRLADLILHLDYGDEQERLRYYEAYAVMVHLQLIALPALGAAVVVAGGRAAIGPVLLMLAAVLGTVLAGTLHLRRHAVRLELIAMSPRNRAYAAAYCVSCLALVAAIAVRTGGSGFDGGLVIGGAIGAVVGLAAVAVRSSQQRTTGDAGIGVER
jgi:hypothetical protein